MILEEALYHRLRSDPALTALAGGRIYPAQAPPASSAPFVLYGQADRLQTQTLTGTINLNAYQMELDVWAESYAEVKAVMSALRARLVGYSGTITAAGGTTTVLGIFEVSGGDGAEQPQHAEGLGLWTASLALAIHYGE